MAFETIAAELGEMRDASDATGTALTTTAALVSLVPGTQLVALTPRNFSTAVVARYALNPYLVVLDTRDDLATKPLDASYRLQDGDNTVVLTLSSFSTAANLDYLYIGSHLPFRGVSVDVQATNSTASDLTVNYWTGEGWSSLSATDNTANGGATFNQDGTVTWTVPANWAAARLKAINTNAASYPELYYKAPMFWTRWQVSAALDSSVTVNQMRALNRSTSYGGLVSGQARELSVTWGLMGHATVEAVTDAGTANLLVQCATRKGSKFLPVAS